MKEKYKNTQIKNIIRGENVVHKRPRCINDVRIKLNFDGYIKKQHPVSFMKFLRNEMSNFIYFNEFKEKIRS